MKLAFISIYTKSVTRYKKKMRLMRLAGDPLHQLVSMDEWTD